MFSKTVLRAISRKSWKTTPMVRRRCGICECGKTPMLRPLTRIWPVVGGSSRKSSRKSVDLPAPEGPVRKTNSPGATWKEMSRRASRNGPYFFETP
jgi:hypothetical protein